MTALESAQRSDCARILEDSERWLANAEPPYIALGVRLQGHDVFPALGFHHGIFDALWRGW